MNTPGKRTLRPGWLLAVLLLCLPAAGASAQVGAANEVIVRTAPGAGGDALAADYGVEVEDRVPGTDTYALRVPAGTTAAAFAARLQRDTRVLSAEEASPVTLPEFSGSQMHLAFDGGPTPGKYLDQTAYRQIDLGKALTMARGAGVVVAVLDTGAALGHPALSGHFVPGYNAFAPGQPPVETPDGVGNLAMGHGTMIAGLIARVAPDAKIMPVRVLNGDGIGDLMTVIQGIHYAATHGARVLNLSLGSPTYSAALKEAVGAALDAGVVVVAAAGNDGGEVPHYPAAFGDVICVGAVEDDNRKSDYSNYGAFVRAVAPGTGIRSTYWDGGYATWTGTSFAAPFVAAEAALVLSVSSQFKGEAAGEDIGETAHSLRKQNPLLAYKLGEGLIDVAAAVRRAVRLASSPPGGGKGRMNDP
jgi:subtilisin family serine protease